ncbi:unnamed protein product [Gadus morhua 'NCC']
MNDKSNTPLLSLPYWHGGLPRCDAAAAGYEIGAGLKALPGELQTHEAELQPGKRGHRMFLQPVLSCSTFKPQVGQALMEGQGPTPATWDSVMVPHPFSSSRSLSEQSSLSQRSLRGALPFQGLRHCQQNCLVGLLLSLQIVQRKQRLSKASLSK